VPQLSELVLGDPVQEERTPDTALLEDNAELSPTRRQSVNEVLDLLEGARVARRQRMEAVVDEVLDLLDVLEDQ